MKRLNETEKRQIGHIIHFYRSDYFHSKATNSTEYKQINFCNGICSQAQLSRLEHGEPLKDQNIYSQLLEKLNLKCEKVSMQDYIVFETYFENILTYQNDDDLIINYNQYVLLINKNQNIFKNNIIYTHYNYALEFILNILNDDFEEASYNLELVEKNLDILPPKFLILTLQYLGIYYHLLNNYNNANKFYLLSIEHMHKSNINNPIIYIDIAFNYIKMKKSIYSLDYLNKALDIFINTHNYEILEKIYRCYGIINLENKYYDDGLNFLANALEYSKKINKVNILLNDYYLLAIGLYLRGFYERGLVRLEEADKIQTTDRSYVIKTALLIKLEKPVKQKKLQDKYCNWLLDYFLCEEKEECFENIIEPNLSEIPEILKIIILNDMFSLYKTNKKYKKALELLESYII